MAFLSHNLGQNDSPNPPNFGGMKMNFAGKSWRQQFGFIRYISRFDFYVLLFGSGIAGYFTLLSEPPFIVFAALLALALILGCLLYTSPSPRDRG